jgi:type II secretory pathway component PulK
MNSYERDAHAIAHRQAARAYNALLEAGVDKSEAAEAAHRVFDQEYRYELAEAYGMDDRELREDLEVLANCLEPDEDES